MYSLIVAAAMRMRFLVPILCVVLIQHGSYAWCEQNGNAVVMGTVRTPEGVPVANALVLSGGQTSVTNQIGEFQLNRLKSGICAIQVQGKNGEVRNLATEARIKSRAKSIDITLFPFSPSCTFEFVDSRGQRISKRRLMFSSKSESDGARTSGSIHVDEMGRWKSTSLDTRTTRFVFGWPSIGYAEESVEFKDGVEETGRVVRLLKSVTLRGTVRDKATGTPVGGAVLTPIRVDSNGEYDEMSPWNGLFGGIHTRFVRGYPITTVSKDVDGTYEIPNLPRGRYRLLVSSGTHRTNVDVSVEDNKDVKVDIFLPKLNDVGSISGKILMPDGSPLVMPEVNILVDTAGPKAPMYGPLNGVPRVTSTDDLGRFRLFPIDSRYKAYWLTANVKDYVSNAVKVESRLHGQFDSDVVIQMRESKLQAAAPTTTER